MNVKISVFVIFVETIIYFLIYNLRDYTFKFRKKIYQNTYHIKQITSSNVFINHFNMVEIDFHLYAS